MARPMREIIRIDEDLCNGCGDCVPSCAEGAIQIIDGKAKLVAENLCDGFGNCLGTCPTGAIIIEKRRADEYDEAAVERHLAGAKNSSMPASISVATAVPVAMAKAHQPLGHHSHGGGCPGSAMRSFAAPVQTLSTADIETQPSALTQWPVQLMLVPPTAPFLRGRDILLVADCCPFAYADFHKKYLAGNALLIGCPKLDDLGHYKNKLAETFRHSGCTGVTVMIMEVPCCHGLKMAAQEALKESGASVPLKEVVVGIRGDIIRENSII